MLFQTLFRKLTGRYASQPAISMDGECMSYAALRQRVDSLSYSLRSLGCQAGDKIVYARCAGVPYVETFLAAVQIGAVFCPVSPRSQPEEFLGTLRGVGPDFLLADPDLLEVIGQELPFILPPKRTITFVRSRRYLRYQSLMRHHFVLGQVDIPEQAPAAAVWDEQFCCLKQFSHGQLCQWLRYCGQELRHPAGVTLMTIPFSCAAYLQELCLGLVCGDELIPAGSFTAKDFIRLVSTRRITSTYLTPSMVRVVRGDSDVLNSDLSSLRHIRCGQAYFDHDTARGLRDLLPDGCVLEKHTWTGACMARLVLQAPQLCQGDWETANIPLNSIGRPEEGWELQAQDERGAPLSAGALGRLYARREDAPWIPLDSSGWISADGLCFLRGRELRHLLAPSFPYRQIQVGESNLSTPARPVSLEFDACRTIVDTFSGISPHGSTTDFSRGCCAAVMKLLPRCRGAAVSIPQRSLQASITRHYIIQEILYPAPLPDLPTSFWVRAPHGLQSVTLDADEIPPGLRLVRHPIYAAGHQLLGELYLAVPEHSRLNSGRQAVLLLILRHLATLISFHRDLSETATRLELYRRAIELSEDGVGISGLESKPVLLFVNAKSAQMINLGKADPDFGGKLEQVQTANFQDLRQGGLDHCSRSFFYQNAARGKVWVNYRAERVLVDGEPYAITFCNMQGMAGSSPHLEGLLSSRELALLQLIAEGLTNKEISARLGISINTVKFHLAQIYKKMQVTNRTELLSCAFLRNG